jgi:D-Tyr-tRNAtyr deacylase
LSYNLAESLVNKVLVYRVFSGAQGKVDDCAIILRPLDV